MVPYDLIFQLFTIFQIGAILLVLVAAAYYDLKKGIIPPELTMSFAFIGFIYSLFPDTMINIIIATCFVVIALPLYMKHWLGGGDVKLIAGILLFTPIMFIKPEFYFLFGLFTCIAGLGLFLAIKGLLLFNNTDELKQLVENFSIRLAPAIAIGWAAAVILML